MKIIFTVLLLLSFLKADEIDRIDSIVLEITNLRADYKVCKKELGTKKTQKIVAITDSKDDEIKKLYLIIEKLEKQLLFNNNLLKTEEIMIKKLKKSCKKVNIKSKDNLFPKLMMKKEYKKESIVNFKASSFHLLNDSIIYDKINGAKVDKWVKNTSFTSSVKTENWIKITGYFINKKWTSAKKELWIELNKVSKK